MTGNKNSSLKKAPRPPKQGVLPETSAKKKTGVREELAVNPIFGASHVVEQFGKPFGDLDFFTIAGKLIGETEKLWQGDMKGCESMLLAQAQALQSIFTNLSIQASRAEYMDNMERYMRMALKAQNQCRATIETLAAIKNPPVVFAKQANIAHGHQQVNNGVATTVGGSIAPAGNDEFERNELLEIHDGQRLDTGAAGAAGHADPAMATLGKVNRA